MRSPLFRDVLNMALANAINVLEDFRDHNPLATHKTLVKDCAGQLTRIKTMIDEFHDDTIIAIEGLVPTALILACPRGAGRAGLVLVSQEIINLLETNGKRYGDKMLLMFKEQYPLMHGVAKCMRIESMIDKNDPSLDPIIEEESRDVLGYVLLLLAIQRGLILEDK